MLKSALFAVLAATAYTAQAAVFPRNGAVKELTAKTWDTKFVDDGVSMVPLLVCAASQ